MLGTSGASLGKFFKVTNATGSTPAYTINQRGTGKILELQDAGSDVFSVSDGGAVTTGTWQGTAIGNTYLAEVTAANKINLSSLNIDGGADIGADLADADLLIVDDAGGGTNRKSAVTRIPTYTFTKISGDVLINSSGVAAIQANSVALTTDTVGDYVATIAGTTNEIEVTGSGTEGRAVTIGLPDDVTISGDLTVSGDTTTVSSTVITVNDPLIALANNNTGNAVDIGFYGTYRTNGTDLYTGIFWDAGNSVYRLFHGNQAEPSTTVNVSGTGFTVSMLHANVTGALTGNAATATILETARNIGGVSFNGSGDINLPGVNTAGNQATSGNAATATALETGRTINGVSFDGTGNITITAAGSTLSDTVPVSKGGTGATTLNDLITLATHTTGNYVATVTGGTGITSTGATSGENIAHSLSVDASQTQITAIGTVTTGVWNGTAITSAYLDADTAHLSGTQTFTGAKTFSSTMTATNIEMGDGGYIRFGGDYPMIDDNGYLQFVTATDADFWWTHGSTNLMHLDSSAATLSILGATPKLIIGNGGTVDIGIELNGNAQDFYIGLDDSLDDLQIKTGTTVGSGTGIRINGSGMVAFNGNATLDSDGAKLFIKGGTTSTAPAGIAWTFNSADTEYAFIHLDYDLRATAGEGLKMKSANGYMMTFDAGNDMAFQTDDVTRMLISNGGSITFGVDDDGEDVTFFGATAGKKMLWDESLDILHLADSTAIKFGNDLDAQMYHDGSNGFITNTTGSLFITDTNGHIYLRPTTSEEGIIIVGSGAVELYYDNAKKLATHTSGVEITGSLEVATIDYTDGDLAMTIADGGTVTFDDYVGMGGTATAFTAAAGLAIKKNGDNLYLEQSNADNGWIVQTLDSTGALSFERRGEGGSPSNTTHMTITTTGKTAISSAAVPSSFNSDYNNLIVGSGSGHNGMFIYSGNTSQGGLMFHDAANTSLSGFVTYDHNINYLYFGTQGLGRISMYGGTSPVLRIGIGQTYDTTLLFDGNAVDFHIGLDDSTDRLVIGTGATLGSNTAMRISSTGNTTFDGNVVIEHTGSSSPTFALKNFNADATSSYFDIWKLGGSPADNDYLGIQRWIGKNTADEDIVYATMYGTSLDVTDSTEDGGIVWQAMREGTNRTTLQVAWGGVYLYHTGNIVAQTGSEGLWIGDGGAEDQTIVWNGNAQDYYWGIDDTDDSFRLGLGSTAGTDTVISISTAGITYFTDTSGIYVKDGVPWYWGTGADYRMEYEPENTRWTMWTNDTNGSGSNEDLIRIEDGQKSIDANTTWDDNAFDAYDDAMLLASSISPTAESYDFGKGIFKRGKEALIEAGVLKRYEDDGWIGYNDQRMSALLAGGIYQTRELVDNLRNEVEELKRQLKEALNG